MLATTRKENELRKIIGSTSSWDSIISSIARSILAPIASHNTIRIVSSLTSSGQGWQCDHGHFARLGPTQAALQTIIMQASRVKKLLIIHLKKVACTDTRNDNNNSISIVELKH